MNELLESLKAEIGENTEEEEEEEEEEEGKKLDEQTKLTSSGIGSGKAGGSPNKKPSSAASSSSKIETAANDDEGYPQTDQAKVVAKEGAAHNVRANVICPGFVRTPLVEKQIPEQAKALGISEQDVIKNVMLKETVDGEFTTTDDVAQVALMFASFPTNALTGQSLVVSHGWFMQ